MENKHPENMNFSFVTTPNTPTIQSLYFPIYTPTHKPTLDCFLFFFGLYLFQKTGYMVAKFFVSIVKEPFNHCYIFKLCGGWNKSHASRYPKIKYTLWTSKGITCINVSMCVLYTNFLFSPITMIGGENGTME